MSEDVARAVGANSPGEFEVAGKKCRLRPLTVKELTEVTREGIRLYRRQYLEAIRESLEFMPNPDEYFQKKVEETAGWQADDLPKKIVYDVSTLKPNRALIDWLVEKCGVAEDKISTISTFQRVMGGALDSEMLSEEEFTKLNGGVPPKKVRTGYINWWVTGTVEGMLAMIWQSVKTSGVTREEVDTLMSDPARMSIFSREIEVLSVPDVGNG